MWRHQSRSQEAPSDGPVVPQDRQELILLHPNLDTKEVRKRWRENVPSWQEEDEPMTMYVGHSFYIYFNVFNDANSTRTWMFLDDVRLIVCYTAPVVTATPSATPLAGDTVTPTPTVTNSLGAAFEPESPDLGSGIHSAGERGNEATSPIPPPRATPPTASASTSPAWTAFLGLLSRYRALIFGGLLAFVLVAIFALRR